MMVKMAAGGVADGIQFSDFTVDMMPEEAMPQIRKSACPGRDPQPVADFRIGNFWAWHMKKRTAMPVHV